MNRFGISVFALTLLIVPFSAARADVCEGLTGQAFGLCQAGVAVGCASQTGPAQACAKLEQKFEDVVGEPAPWIATCPCDYTQVSLALQKSGGPWLETDEHTFRCHEFPDVVGPSDTVEARFDSRQEPNKLVIELRYTDGLPARGECGISIDSEVLDHFVFTGDHTLAVSRACRSDVIAYGNAFIALHPEVNVNELCTE